MLQSFDQFRLNPQVEVPKHLDEFVVLGTDVLRQAHQGTLDLWDTSVRTQSDIQADRLYIEHLHNQQKSRLAVHLGHAGQWLMVSLEQPRHTTDASGFDHLRSTVVIEKGNARVFHVSPTGSAGPEDDITNNEIAGRYFTSRLYRAFGELGIYSAEQLEAFQQAS